MPAPPADASRCPRADRVGREPEGDVAPPHEGAVVLGPVPDAIRCLVLRMHARRHIEIMTRRRSRWSTCRPLLAHRAESAHQRRAKASAPAGFARPSPLIDHPPDPAGLVVRDVEAAVRALGNARGPVSGVVGRHQRHLTGEAVGEDLVVAGRRLGAGEWDENDVVAALRQRRAVPRAVEDDERATLVACREHRPGVEHQVVRRPVAGEADERRRVLVAPADHLAVTAVLRIEHPLALLPVVEAVGPAEVRAFFDLQELLRRQLGVLLVGKPTGPQGVELIPPVLDQVEPALGRVPRHGEVLPHSSRVVLARRLRLIGRGLVELPDAAMLIEHRTGVLAQLLRDAAARLAGVRRRSDVDEHPAFAVEGDSLGAMAILVRQRDEDLQGRLRHERVGEHPVALDRNVAAEVEVAAVQLHCRAPVLAESLLDVHAAVAVGVAQRNDAAQCVLLVPDGDVDVAVRRHGQMPRGAEAVGHD